MPEPRTPIHIRQGGDMAACIFDRCAGGHRLIGPQRIGWDHVYRFFEATGICDPGNSPQCRNVHSGQTFLISKGDQDDL